VLDRSMAYARDGRPNTGTNTSVKNTDAFKKCLIIHYNAPQN